MHLQLQYTPYVIPLAVAAVIAAILILVAWRRHEVGAALPFGLLTLSIFEWSVGYGLELTFADLPAQVFWAKIEYFGIVSLPLAWLAFAVIYTGHERWLTRRRLFLLSAIPLITLTLVWTNEWHSLIWSQTAARFFDSASIMSPTRGVWFWVHTAYSYVLILGGTILILQTIVHSSRLYHGQAGVLVISALAPWVGNAAYLLGISPFSYLDLTPFAFTVSGLALAWDLARYQLLDIVPVARGLVVQSMDDAVLVLDARNRIVDLNPAAEQLLGRNAAEVTGAPVQLILSAWRDLVERYADIHNAHDEVSLGEGTEQRWFDLRISPVSDSHGDLTGRLLVLRDITQYKQTEEALRETRDELDMRVQARTRDLATANENLLAEITERKRAEKEIQQRALEQSTLSDIARALNAELDVRQAFPVVVASLRHLTRCDHASITLLDAYNQTYTVVVLDEPRMEWKAGDRVAATASNTTVNLLAGRAHISGDLSTELDLPVEQSLYLAGVRSRVVLPLMAGATVLGGLNLASTLTNTFDEAQLPLLQQIANAVAISVENTRLFDAEQTRRAELTALYDLSRVLADAPPDSDSILELVARHAVETIHVTFARVLLLEKEDLVVRAAYPRRDLDRDFGVGIRAAASAYPFCQRVMEHNDPLVVCAEESEMSSQEYDALFLGMCQSICVVPLRTEGRSLGLIVLGEERSEEREPFTPEKIRLARSIGDQAASALHRVELFDEVERSYLETVLSLANAVEAKDSYTADHVQNVARMALTIGREMGMSQRELESLRFGAILHDIGKIGIPDAILRKPGPLDAKEWEIMRQHPVIGERILVPIRHLRDAAQIVRHHHEKYGGRGYPDGLVGEAIPLGARILTVVDSYSAIIDRRTYKPARSHEQAVAELSRCAGTQFDPNIVELFLRREAQRVENVRPAVLHSA